LCSGKIIKLRFKGAGYPSPAETFSFQILFYFIKNKIKREDTSSGEGDELTS